MHQADAHIGTIRDDLWLERFELDEGAEGREMTEERERAIYDAIEADAEINQPFIAEFAKTDFDDDTGTLSPSQILDMMKAEIVSKKEGIVKYPASVANIRQILRFDARFRKKIGLNVRTNTLSFVKDVDFQVDDIAKIRLDDGEAVPFQKGHYSSFIAFLDEPMHRGGYGLENPNETKVKDALVSVARANEFDQVRDMFEEAHRGWDGVRGRMERLFIDFLGAEDNDYHREAAVIFMTGMVMRTMEPGCPFKHILILQGEEEDSGKSAALGIMAGGHIKIIGKGGLDNIKTMSEEMRGPAVINFEEMVAFQGLSFAHLNLAIELNTADARVAYGENAEKYKVRHVPTATTNEAQMIDSPNLDSGSRYLIVKVGEQFNRFNRMPLDALREAMPGIWAEAQQHYLDLRQAQPKNPIHLKLSGEAEKYRMKLTRAARVESQGSLLTGRIESLLTEPVGKVGDDHVREWVRSKDYGVIDGMVYRMSWFRPAIFDLIVRDIETNGGGEDMIRMIRSEEAKSGRHSPFVKAINELRYVTMTDSAKPIRGLETYKTNRVLKVDAKKLAERLAEIRAMAKQDEDEEIPF